MPEMQTTCPKCGHVSTEARPDCERCGVFFAKLKAASERPATEDLYEAGFGRMVLEPQRLYIEQHYRHWWEILANLEQRNEYSVSDQQHRLVGWIVEQGQGIGPAILRIIAGSHRPFEIAVMSTEQELVLEFSREFFFFFSSMDVKGPTGRLFGRVQRRFAVLSRVYDLEDPNGMVFARISSPLFKIWTFPIVDTTGQERAVISKKWSGLGKEYFTDADNFGIDFGAGQWTAEQRAVILAASVAIDFDFFENNNQS